MSPKTLTGPSSTSTTPRRARPSSSSSTATTSRTARSSRCPRSSRRARASHERTARLHEHALQAPLRLPAEGRRGRLGHPPGAPPRAGRGGRGRLQGGPPADAGPARRAVPALPADRRRVRLPEPRVRGLGGRRRDRDARDARRRGGDPDVRRLDRPRRVPARLGERLPDDDAARRERRQRLHAGACRGALRDPAGPDPGLHRAQGRHLRQHPGRPGHRGQDRRTARRAVRLARGRARARRGAVAGAAEEPDEFAEQARAAKVLATMRRDLELDCDPAELVLAPPDRSQLRETFRQFEFRASSGRVDELDEAVPRARADLRRHRGRLARGRGAALDSIAGIAADDGRVAVALGDEVVVSPRPSGSRGRSSRTTRRRCASRPPTTRCSSPT